MGGSSRRGVNYSLTGIRYHWTAPRVTSANLGNPEFKLFKFRTIRNIKPSQGSGPYWYPVIHSPAECEIGTCTFSGIGGWFRFWILPSIDMLDLEHGACLYLPVYVQKVYHLR